LASAENDFIYYIQSPPLRACGDSLSARVQFFADVDNGYRGRAMIKRTDGLGCWGRAVAVAFYPFLASPALGADLLPLMQGIFVEASTPCKAAPLSRVINYWGDDAAIGAAQTECKITRVTHKGTQYHYASRCKDVASGESYEDHADLEVLSPTVFRFAAQTYRYCGKEVQF
jgi:hypothetical protein